MNVMSPQGEGVDVYISYTEQTNASNTDLSCSHLVQCTSSFGGGLSLAWITARHCSRWQGVGGCLFSL
jgi:hypothetical protein